MRDGSQSPRLCVRYPNQSHNPVVYGSTRMSSGPLAKLAATFHNLCVSAPLRELS